ncbi:MAG: NfeD family protein [Actinomycetota bacterium]|nr:NfeD family protein [Actinomycetota bacterium]
MLWLAWLAVALVLGVAEFFTLTLALGLLAGAAAVAAVVAGAGGSVLLQVLAFAVAGSVGLLVVRPIARRHMAQPPLIRDGSDALVGRPAIVTREVTDVCGLIRLSGEEWSARSFDEQLVIPVGARVDVMQIDGATAVVYPRDPLP